MKLQQRRYQLNLLDLGKTIKTLRKEKGLTQQELAKKSGISRVTLSKLENGYIANISIVTINQVLSLLGYEIDIKHTNPFHS